MEIAETTMQCNIEIIGTTTTLLAVAGGLETTMKAVVVVSETAITLIRI